MTINNCCNDLRAVKTYCIQKLNKQTVDYIDVIDINNNNKGSIFIQRSQVNSPVNFNRNWTDYEEEFGDLNIKF